MASMTRTDTTGQTVYVITDNAGSTMTMTVAIDAILGNTVTFTSSGGLHPDGLAMLGDNVWLLTTGLLPSPQPANGIL